MRAAGFKRWSAGPIVAVGVAALAATAEAQPIGTLAFVPFANAPFPYDGLVPETGQPFLDVVQQGRRGHLSWRGGVYWEDETYSDDRSLIFVPRGFDVNAPATIVVFFHGNEATLERDVVARQNLPAQLAASGLNAVLVAPQFAVDALDSSAGRFWLPGAFAAYIGEASDRIADVLGDRRFAARFDRMPVVIVAYSGGYYPTAFAATLGGSRRVCGIVLLDGLFGEEDYFARWIAGRGAGFFYSAYALAAREYNQRLQEILAANGIGYAVTAAPLIGEGTVAFQPVSLAVSHTNFVTQAWTANPVRAVLSTLATSGACRG